MTTKQRLRQEIISWRSQYSQQQFDQWSRQITERLLKLETVTQATCPLLFMSMPGEFDTTYLRDWYQKHQVKVILPRVHPKRQLKLYQLDSTDPTALTTHRLGFNEPAEHLPMIEPTEIDLVILPAVTCNTNGARLGYGGGYYDRLLKKIPVTTPLILPFFEQLMVESIPVEAHDHLVDQIVTQSHSYTINNPS